MVGLESGAHRAFIYYLADNEEAEDRRPGKACRRILLNFKIRRCGHFEFVIRPTGPHLPKDVLFRRKPSLNLPRQKRPSNHPRAQEGSVNAREDLPTP
jgi:hypothetical protein